MTLSSVYGSRKGQVTENRSFYLFALATVVKHWIVTQLIMQTTIAAGQWAACCQHLARVGPGVEKVECGEKYFRILSITTDFA